MKQSNLSITVMATNKVTLLQQMISVVFVTQKQILHAVRNPLPVCGDCLKLDIKLPVGVTDSFVKKRELARQKKAALKEKAVAAGRKKGCTKH